MALSALVSSHAPVSGHHRRMTDTSLAGLRQEWSQCWPMNSHDGGWGTSTSM